MHNLFCTAGHLKQNSSSILKPSKLFFIVFSGHTHRHKHTQLVVSVSQPKPHSCIWLPESSDNSGAVETCSFHYRFQTHDYCMEARLRAASLS